MLSNNDVNEVLDSDESIHWQGKVARAPLFVVAAVIVIVSLLIGWWLINQEIFNYTLNDVPKQTSGIIAGLITVALGAIIVIFYLWYHLIREFFITDKRVLIKSGMIGTDFTSIYFNEIKRIEVEVNLIGKIFSVGTIKIDIGKTETYSTNTGPDNRMRVGTKTIYDYLYYISNPYEVYRQLQTILNERLENLYSGKVNNVNKLNEK